MVPVLLFTGIPSAMPLTESFAREMEIADEATYNRVLAIPDGKEFIGPGGKVFARELSWSSDSFLIVRVEDANCSGEYCSTAIISARQDGDRIIGIGWLPKSIRQSDVSYKWCQVCGSLFSVSFEDSNQASITIGLSPNYMVVSGQTE